ncbi:hypothetical protein WR25_07527 [Diploscapter pachys]|uniref:Homeobox domain-containing protein n=1 Tax=Diploscapter pachys TaxID=2018661 RepID=A0A2A2JKJ9_9BILA|nr:hypothetical protein WR25_07527 [Diploscapter pachys]
MNSNGAVFADFTGLTASSAITGSTSSLLNNGVTTNGNVSATATSSVSTPGSTTSDGNDHLQKLAAMAHGVGKEDPDSATSASSAEALYQGFPASAAPYLQNYASGWPNCYPQFGQAFASGTIPAWSPYYGHNWTGYSQSKKGRQTYQRYQTSVLEQKFQQSSYVSKKQREELRLQTNLTDRQIKIWFQNRRMKAKKEKQRIDDQGEPPHTLPLPASATGAKPQMPVNHHAHHQLQLGTTAGMANMEDDKAWPAAAVAANMAAATWNHTMMLQQHPAPYHLGQYPLCQQ